MVRYVVKRLLMMIVTLFGVSVLVFSLLQIMPGDPVDSLLPPDATPEMRAELEAEYGFDQPLVIQYLNWLNNITKLNFGESIMYQTDVFDMIKSYFGNTLILALSSFIFAFVLSVLIGFLGAVKNKSFFGFFSNIIGIGGVSIPNYWLALIIIGIFTVVLRWLPSTGMHTYGNTDFGDLAIHLILPTIAGGAATLGILTTVVRNAINESLSSDYITTIKAKGMPNRVVYKHVFKNSLTSITTVGGLQFGYLLGGSAVVETIFAWSGIGQMVYRAITQRDFPVIQGTILVISCLFVLLNLAVDLINAYIDPRIKE